MPRNKIKATVKYNSFKQCTNVTKLKFTIYGANHSRQITPDRSKLFMLFLFSILNKRSRSKVKSVHF
jgi:hypothetical protein